MGVRFILGRSGTGKSSRTLTEIKEKLINDPNGPPILYIVPEQMTFQREYALFSDPEIKGSFRAQVVSFSRLAWRILQETGGGTKQFISSVGSQMVLQKIIEEKQSGWHVFQRAAEKQGFIQELERMITEFKRYNITPELLEIQIEQMNKFVHKDHREEALIQKLQDLFYVYEHYSSALKDKYIDTEDQLQMLVGKINEASFIHEADIYFEGFHRFTPKEYLVVEALMKNCRLMTFTLTTELPKDEHPSELNLFYQTIGTYRALRSIAKDHYIDVDEVIQLDEINGRFKDRPYFAHLERYFDTRPAPSYEDKAPIKIVEAVHPRAEIEGVAQEIIKLVREENYRYKDMAILIRETETYHDLIATVFNDYNIPVFIDEKQSMLHHSLIEFVRSLFDVVEGNWRYDAVFRLLKTGYIKATDDQYPLTYEAIDELENYVLEYGVYSRNRWFTNEPWKYERYRGFEKAVQTDDELDMERRINSYRQQVIADLKPFDEQMRKSTSVLEKCEIIYRLLEQLQVPEQLEKMRKLFDDQGENEKGREQEQVWDAMIQLFDEIVEIAGETEMSLSTFRAILETGFESLTFAHVPPSMDHVIVGTIDRSRLSNIKCAFLLGVNEGIWPLKPPGDGIISEFERELLADHGLQLAESSKRKLLDDWFYMYLAFTSCRDYLYVSYTLSNEEGEGKIPSSLIKRLQDLFPHCSKPILLQDPDELMDANRFIQTPTNTRSALTSQLARYHNGYPIESIWWYVLDWYVTNHKKYSTTYNVLQSLYYHNQPDQLSKETVSKLYPKQIHTSISRLETYYRCSFQHFARYNLQLEERKTYKLEAPDMGQLFHEALKLITGWVKEENETFAKVTKEEADSYAGRAVQQLAPILQHEILRSTNRRKYIKQKLQEIIAQATYILSEQAKLSGFSPIGIEVGFGPNETLKPLKVSLGEGFELVLRGRIDRIDQALKGDSLYLRIIDYKSSGHELNLDEVYYGISIQMLAYLEVILSQAEEWLKQKATPAGVLYFHMHRPLISKNEKVSDEQLIDDIFKEYKMQGLLLADQESIQLMDMSLESGRSDIIPAGIRKNGQFYKDSKVTSQESFDQLHAHIYQLIKRAGINMVTGQLEINPYQHKNKTPCTFCAYRSLCQFDPVLEDNQYRNLTKKSDEEILTKLLKGENESW